MKMNREYKPELIASQDETRFHLCSLHLDADKKRLVATNGHALVSVPVVVEDGDHTGAITKDALKHARKARGAKNDPVIKANGAQVTPDGASFARPDVRFPPYEQVIPRLDIGGENTVSVAFNPQLLLDLAKAIGAADQGVVLTFTLDGKDPKIGDLGAMQVRANIKTRTEDGPVAVIMPMRML